MAEREPVRWITVKGKHLPVYEDGTIGAAPHELNGVPVDKNNALPDKPLSPIHAKEWLQKTIGVDERTAMHIRDAFESWSNYGSHELHNDIAEKTTFAQQQLGMPTGKENADLINRYLTDPNVPKYKGELYRGIAPRMADRARIDEMLESGLWKEPGISAFSYDKSSAKLYADASADSLSDIVHITLKNNRHASTIGHLSIGGGEKEALYPRSIQQGIKIVSYTKTPVYGEKFDRQHFRETGERRYNKYIFRYIYDIVLDDR